MRAQPDAELWPKVLAGRSTDDDPDVAALNEDLRFVLAADPARDDAWSCGAARSGSMPTSGWHGLLVRDLMTHPAITVQASASLKDAARLMTDHHIHRLVVVADHGIAPIGVISKGDIVREVAAMSADG